ncbi:TPA: MBL fold metallo-hydrolase [Kluyvera intermedia]|uniref:Beta-lactamase n=2 Tax=Enterobacteriaceae TaxID=543 RepID=A0AAC8QQQ3_9ENTR|nr:Vmh family MBL fold metallo-hydrolase [Phytobacter ursingii]HAT2203832.1 MBL fold metallo-hydrolase [Kluyvera intermedia]AKL13093.1 beta-lactamase [Phytobacter ursingii]HAT2514545.1 MBL fold metallo-hydrolase [Kluyvera intermedia]HAT2602439.1 MBL fold metallo-hydrolase [Kluyvera intermedia]HAT2678746.1 MBL fold metallo-hydrolase [Kluyvera intermedia]
MNVKSVTLLLSLAAVPAFAAPLQLDVYNPQEKGIFPVSSTLVSGPKEAVLFDAQFSVKDGEELVKLIKARGKALKEIVITSGDPDFYFGLEPLVKAFPQAKVVASKAVVDHINATKEAKLAFWGPQMKEGAPTKLIVPQVTTATRFTVDGEPLELKHTGDYAAYVWIPANKAILGGTGIASGIHVWTADTQTPAIRKQWMAVLSEMQALKPQQVIPGHYLGERPAGDGAITFTHDYLNTFEQTLASKKGSAAVIEAMKAAYPKLADESSLELSAKVNTGEMKW